MHAFTLLLFILQTAVYSLPQLSYSPSSATLDNAKSPDDLSDSSTSPYGVGLSKTGSGMPIPNRISTPMNTPFEIAKGEPNQLPPDAEDCGDLELVCCGITHGVRICQPWFQFGAFCYGGEECCRRVFGVINVDDCKATKIPQKQEELGKEQERQNLVVPGHVANPIGKTSNPAANPIGDTLNSAGEIFRFNIKPLIDGANLLLNGGH